MFAVVAAAIASIVPLCVLCILPSCAANTSLATAKQIKFAPSLENDYQLAVSAIEEKADDAKLIAIRLSSFADSETTPSWMYLFYSWNRASAYTVFVVEGEATIGETGNLPFTQSDFEAVPDASNITYDADAAFELLLDTIKKDDELSTCRAYLMTYVEGDDDPTVDAMKWFFSFNDPNDIESISNGEETEDENDSSLTEHIFSVDAQSGEVIECMA